MAHPGGNARPDGPSVVPAGGGNALVSDSEDSELAMVADAGPETDAEMRDAAAATDGGEGEGDAGGGGGGDDDDDDDDDEDDDDDDKDDDFEPEPAAGDDKDDDEEELVPVFKSSTRIIWVKKKKPAPTPTPRMRALKRGQKKPAAKAKASTWARGGRGAATARGAAKAAPIARVDDEAKRSALGLRTRERKTYNDDVSDDFEESDDDDDDDDDDAPRVRRPAKKKARAKAEDDAKAPPPLAVDFRGADPDIPTEIDKVLDHRPTALDGTVADWSMVQFHIKWRFRSYLHSDWVDNAEIEALPGYKKVVNYVKREKERLLFRASKSRDDIELEDANIEMQRQLIEDYRQVERVVAEDSDSGKLLCKWSGLPYAECTWEDPDDVAEFMHEVDLFRDRAQAARDRGVTVEKARAAYVRDLSARGAAGGILSAQPQCLKGGSLRDYQLAGLNWAIKAWTVNMNGILADEMGLGKTVQCVSVISWLLCLRNVRGPFLVVVPLSTITNWEREFKKWCDRVNCVTYVGDAQSRGVVRDWEFYTTDYTSPAGAGGKRRKGEAGGFLMNVLLTTTIWL